jgi:hypothetical protein
MFGSTVLDLATGVIFGFLMISLVTSAVTEAIASKFGWRADTLLQGVKDLLNDQQFTGLARSIYNHAAVNARSNGTAQTESDLNAKPSYIDSRQFAGALIDTLGLTPGVGAAVNVAGLQAQINATVPDQQIRTMLNGIVARTGGNVNRIRDEIAAWFDSGMERVAGSYKRYTQAWGFCIGLACAILLNIDTVRIANDLWSRPVAVKEISATANMTADDALTAARKLGIPYGWDTKAVENLHAGPNMDWIYMVIGWLISAVATLFGAPFWFDALQKFVQLRGAGSK